MTGTRTKAEIARDTAYDSFFDQIAGMEGGPAFLREYAKRCGDKGQEQVRRAVRDMKRLVESQAKQLQAAGRADMLRHELVEMAATIDRARREVASLQPKNATDSKLLMATSELDAIVSTTERASFEILQAAERLMDLVMKVRKTGAANDACDAMDVEITNIFTACSFQDLTGQRTNKIIGALRYVEQRVIAMMSIWSLDGVQAAAEEPVDKRPDAHLLGGPRDDGVSQDDIDAMMAAAAPGGGDASGPMDQSDIDNMFG